jgi:hypothetical protein
MSQSQDPTPRRYPYYFWEGAPAYDEALETLYESTKDGEPHIPTLAQQMLKELASVGLLHTREDQAPSNIRKVSLGGEQELWIRFDTYRRAFRGYMAIDVVDAPRSDAAILAAMIAWLAAEPMDLKKGLWAIKAHESPAVQARLEKVEATHKRILDKGQDISFEEIAENLKFMAGYLRLAEAQQPLNFLMPLIKYYRPEIEDYSPEEQLALLEKGCRYINNFLEALGKLQAFLEYGSPSKKLSPSIEEPNRDVQAVVLHDVDGLNYRQIGEKMKIPLPSNFEVKGDHQTVRKMVERGRNILERAFGEEGWRERAETMKAEKEWWRSLSREEQVRELDAVELASDLGIPLEEARRRLESCHY